VAGGLPANCGRLLLIRDGRAVPIAPKTDGMVLRRGDIVRLETSGGDGFGEPSARDAAALRRDLALGYVTPAAARDAYGAAAT
jgi:N-methylhydantoinase B/oxoprolinase/acetone carboxylase alpha subunit